LHTVSICHAKIGIWHSMQLHLSQSYASPEVCRHCLLWSSASLEARI